MFHSNDLKLMRDFYTGYNIINFACGNTGARMVGWFCREVKALGDMKGLKMRIGNFGGKVLKHLGSVPLNIPGGRAALSLNFTLTRNPTALKQPVAAGAQLRPFPADVMNAGFRESIRLYAELSDTNPVWAKVYADYAKFRADQNLWIRFTEATFSRFHALCKGKKCEFFLIFICKNYG